MENLWSLDGCFLRRSIPLGWMLMGEGGAEAGSGGCLAPGYWFRLWLLH